MNRTQKKCFIASTGLHLLLALILLVGPAFLTSGGKRDNVQVLTFLPDLSLNANVSSEGGPSSPPTPAPITPAPAPLPAPVVPTPAVPTPPPTVRDVKPPNDTAPANDRHVIVPNLKPTVRNPNATSTRSRTNTDANNTASRQRIADQISQSASGIRRGILSSTSLEVRVGSGKGSGPSYAGFEQTVLSHYDKAWVAPEGMDTSEAVVGVRVTVESDGRVSSARIIERSGDARVDRSVQEALDRVTKIPVPEGTTEPRTVEFDFKSRAKQSI